MSEFLKSINWGMLPNAPRLVIEWITSFVEFLTDHMHGSIAHIMIKASPLMAPLPSAIALYIALVAQFGSTSALVITFVFEALGFAAVFIKTGIDQHNRNNPNAILPNDVAHAAVVGYLVVTEVAIVFFKVVPGWMQWWVDGNMVSAFQHTAPIIFPVFSYIGANIYSQIDVLLGIKNKEQEDRAERKAKESADVEGKILGFKNAIAELTAKLNSANEAHEAVQNAVQAAKLNAESERVARAEMERKLAVLETQKTMMEQQLFSVKRDAELFRDHSLNVQSAPSASRPSARASGVQVVRVSKRDAQVKLVNIVKHEGSQSLKIIGKHLGVSKSTASNYVNELVEIGVLDKEVVDGEMMLRVNGHHEDFLAGRI